MDAKTAKALTELMRAAIKHVTGKEPDGPIMFTVHPDREDQWPEIADRELTMEEPIHV